MRCKGVPPAHVKCFTEYLRGAGYYCTNNVKTDYNFDPPVTAWDECSAKAHYRNRPKGQPFFAVFNNVVTHESQARAARKAYENNTARLTPEQRHAPEKAILPPYYPDTPIVRRNWAMCYDNVTAMDYWVGDMLKELGEQGLAENTIVFFYGDHGRGLSRAKRWVYDSGIHVPLLIRWPGAIKPGTAIDDLVAFIDFGATLLSLAGVPIPEYMQGQAFFGEQRAKPREYVYAARDRMDETYDIIRAARDKRFKYIRNFEPEKPYAQHITYMDEMPIMKEWRRLAAEGELTGPQALFFAPTKPVEELYDTSADPHEVNNLAGKPEHEEALKRMRAALEKWMRDINDLALIPESELNEQRRPGGKWSVTADPRIKASASPDGSWRVTIICPTDGASIAWTTDEAPAGARKDKAGGWNLYTGPFEVRSAQAIRAKACRLGWRDSREVTVNLRRA
jgi:uncharacterized sulfatase